MQDRSSGLPVDAILEVGPIEGDCVNSEYDLLCIRGCTAVIALGDCPVIHNMDRTGSVLVQCVDPTRIAAIHQAVLRDAERVRENLEQRRIRQEVINAIPVLSLIHGACKFCNIREATDTHGPCPVYPENSEE